jgi:hypothetical protein
MKQHLIRIERIAGELNAWLFVIAIGLAMLDLTVLVVKCMPPLPTAPARGTPSCNRFHRKYPNHRANPAFAERRPPCIRLLDLSS